MIITGEQSEKWTDSIDRKIKITVHDIGELEHERYNFERNVKTIGIAGWIKNVIVTEASSRK